MEYAPQPAGGIPKAQAIGEILSTAALAGIGLCVAVLAWAAFGTSTEVQRVLDPITSAGTLRPVDSFFSSQPAGASILVIALSESGAREAETQLAHEERIRKLAGEPSRSAWVVTAADADEAAAVAEMAARDAQLPGAQQVTVVRVP